MERLGLYGDLAQTTHLSERKFGHTDGICLSVCLPACLSVGLGGYPKLMIRDTR